MIPLTYGPVGSSENPRGPNRLPEQRAGTGTALLAIFVLAFIVMAAGAVYFIFNPPATESSSTTSTGNQSFIVTSDPSPYFSNGYYSHVVNFSRTNPGDVIVVANFSFLYVRPTNLETRTMTMGMGNDKTTTAVVVTADYQCGTSMGQRQFFFVQPVYGGSGTAYRLDYCLLLNTAISQGAYQGGVAQSWDLWQISMGDGPTVALHMTGSGEYVSSVELCVGK